VRSAGFPTSSAGLQEWYTPPGIFQALGLVFDLDPCAPPGGLPWIPAKRSYSLLDDGLAQPWRGRVWLNPPYGSRTPLWLQRLAEHGDGIALVFTRTDTGWFHRWVAPRADAVCFIRRQIKFVKGSAASAGDLFDDPVAGAVEGQAKASAGAASMLVAYGDDNAAALVRSGLGSCARFIP
jgi:hypothetical protein